MNSSRYNKSKRSRQKTYSTEEGYKAPSMYSDARRNEVSAAVNTVDEVARNLEQKWGIGKLERLAPPKLAVAFQRATDNFNAACEGDDLNYLIAKCENLIDGWKALEATAIKNGHTPTDVDVWFAVAPPDEGSYSFALVKHPADLASVSKEDAQRAYSLDEVCRIINHWETKMVTEVKDHFPKAEIINIKDFKDDTEIPF